MRLTLHTDYALRVLMHLGRLPPGGLASIREVADAHRISENHLVKVVHGLGRAGFVATLRGRGGGLRLARPPGEIRVGDVVRHAEEDMALVACFKPDGPPGGGCVLAGACRLQGASWARRWARSWRCWTGPPWPTCCPAPGLPDQARPRRPTRLRRCRRRADPASGTGGPDVR